MQYHWLPFIRRTDNKKAPLNMFGLIEHTFPCPYCGSRIDMELERFYGGQEYIEDCQVCCNPIKIHYSIEQDNLTEFKAESIEQ